MSTGPRGIRQKVRPSNPTRTPQQWSWRRSEQLLDERRGTEKTRDWKWIKKILVKREAAGLVSKT